MNKEDLAYIRYQLEKANETLDEARMIFPKHLSGTVNRLYYACFYCANAALLLEGKSTRRHATACKLFADTFVKTGQIPLEMSKFYSTIFTHRQRGDYGSIIIFQEDKVKAWMETTENFVKLVTDFVEKKTQGIRQ